MLAGAQRGGCYVEVLGMGSGDVNDVDGGIVEHALVAGHPAVVSVPFTETDGLGKGVRRFLRAGTDRVELGILKERQVLRDAAGDVPR